MASFEFDNATCERIAMKSCGNLTKTNGTETETCFRLEFECDIIPQVVQKIYDCIRSDFHIQEDESVEIKLITVDDTKLFNFSGNCAPEECYFMCEMSLFDSGNQFVLEHK